VQLQIEVTEEFDGAMLLDFLCQSMGDRSVTFLRKLVASGAVRRGDNRCAAADRVHAGDVLVAEVGEGEGIRYAPRRLPLSVIYEDQRLLVVNKPARLAVLEPAFLNAILYHLQNESPFASGADTVRPLIVHRLDRDASGAVVLAKDTDALRALSKQFGAGQVAKEYRALVHGRVVPPEGGSDLPLRVDRKAIRVRVDRARGKPALTHYRALEQFRFTAWVRIQPATGRLHQIRIHLREAGHPIVCDPLYGDGAPLLLSRFKRDYRAKRGVEERPLISRLALHARSLSFTTPDGGQHVEVEAPLPKDLHVALKMLRKYSAT